MLKNSFKKWWTHLVFGNHKTCERALISIKNVAIQPLL